MTIRLPSVAELARRPITTALVLAAIATTLLWESGLSVDALTMSPRAVGPEPWRLLTSALPHVGLLHLAFNAYWTVVLGGASEARCGARVTAALVLGAAIASAALEHALFSGGVGLSGVGYGLFGFAWVASRRGVAFEDVVDAATAQTFVVWFVICCVTTYTGVLAVGNAAHAGGWVLGMLAGLSWSEPRQRAVTLGGTVALGLVCVVLASAPVRAFVNVRGLAQDLADEAYSLLEGDPARAVTRYDEAIARDDTVANWHYNRGVALQRVARLGESDAAYARALELDANDATYREAVAGSHARRSNEAMLAGRYDEAIVELRAALELVPEHELAPAWREGLEALEAARARGALAPVTRWHEPP
jgi:membrane associated rhomboid family serine protease